MQFKDIISNQKVVDKLLAEVKNDRVSHAQMLIGPEGTAKIPLAIAFAQYLLCDDPSETDSCGICPHCEKINSLTHPDLHFAYPIAISKADKVSSSDDLRASWNEIVTKRIYFNIDDWLEFTESEGKNPIMGVDESRLIQKKLALKSYSDKYKIMIIWLPERMNSQAANKMLKLLEEPPAKTLFLLLCDNDETILPTIISRTQSIHVPVLKTDVIADYIESKYQTDKALAHSIAGLSAGNIVDAIKAIEGDTVVLSYFDLFVKLMRAAYAANPNDLMSVSDEVASLDRERQKNFVKYGLHIFRESMILNYMDGKLLNSRADEMAFLSKFAKFINNQNINELTEEFNAAFYHLERNANPKILFTDLIIKLTKLVRKGA